MQMSAATAATTWKPLRNADRADSKAVDPEAYLAGVLMHLRETIL